MNQFTRRSFVKSASAGGLSLAGMGTIHPHLFASSLKRDSDIRIEDVAFSFEEFVFRTPLKFAGVIVERQTMLTATCTVRTVGGNTATGFGVLPLNYTFTFPSQKLSPETRQGAMKALAAEISKVTKEYREFGHPIDIHLELLPDYLQAATDVSERLSLADPIPRLCTLVTAGAFDAAIHDAFGKVHGRSSFHTYGPEFMNHDLSHYLGNEYKGRYPSDYLLAKPKSRMPLCHLISAVDPITVSENAKPINDGLPETLPEWINKNGLTYLKIKLNGDDLKWDVERMRHINQVTSETQKKRVVEQWTYIPNFNEKCPNVDYYFAFLRQVREQMPDGFRRTEELTNPGLGA